MNHQNSSKNEKTDNMSPFAAECQRFAQSFDAAAIQNDVSTVESLLAKAKEVLKSHNEPSYAPLFYFVGTMLLFMRDNLIKELDASPHAYANEEVIAILGEAIWYFRHALKLVSIEEMDKLEYKPYIDGFLRMLYVNIGNAMDSCGRKSSAIMYYRKAISISPEFGMALGNIGRSLEHYAEITIDPGHRGVFLRNALIYYDKASNDTDLSTYQEAKDDFIKSRDRLLTMLDADLRKKPLSYKEYSLGKGKEKEYRNWCLNNHIFLNPLNDLPDLQTAFATDSLHIGSIIAPVEDRAIPFVFEMLNQIKEEFIYSRWLLFEVLLNIQNVHYADRETHLEDILNYSSYSIRLEKLKTAYRTLYSLFDRTAFLLNAYLGLDIEEKRVSFSSIFNHPKMKQLESENIAIAALHWIDRDFKKRYSDEDSPHAQNLKDLRNALEHKFVSIHMFKPEKELEMGKDFIRRVSEETLIEFSLELIHIVREVIIELTIAVHIEEEKKRDPTKKFLNMPLLEYSDEYKI